MFETTFRNLDDTLRKDAGCSSELDYIEATSWLLFLKYLDDFENDKESAAQKLHLSPPGSPCRLFYSGSI